MFNVYLMPKNKRLKDWKMHMDIFVSKYLLEYCYKYLKNMMIKANSRKKLKNIYPIL